MKVLKIIKSLAFFFIVAFFIIKNCSGKKQDAQKTQETQEETVQETDYSFEDVTEYIRNIPDDWRFAEKGPYAATISGRDFYISSLEIYALVTSGKAYLMDISPLLSRVEKYMSENDVRLRVGKISDIGYCTYIYVRSETIGYNETNQVAGIMRMEEDGDYVVISENLPFIDLLIHETAHVLVNYKGGSSGTSHNVYWEEAVKLLVDSLYKNESDRTYMKGRIIDKYYLNNLDYASKYGKEILRSIKRQKKMMDRY